MRTALLTLARLVAAAATFATFAVAQLALGLEVGDPAPPFRLPGSDGRTHALEDSLGSRGVVLAWFPKAFTPG